jgi:carboxylesterase
MTWHGQISRTVWEIETLLDKYPNRFALKRELLRTHFLQRFEFDRSMHVPRDDRSFLFLQQEAAAACLLFHGGAGTPAEMRDLGNHLYSKGYTVYCPRFSRVDPKNRPVSWESWVTSGQSALQVVNRYSGDVYVIGLSMGGTMALVLNGMSVMKAMVLLSPAIFPRYTLKERVRGLGRRVMPTFFYKMAGWNGEIVKAMEYIREHPKEIEVPALILQARDDRRLSTRGLKFLRRWVVHPKSEIRLLPIGSHVLTRGPARVETFDRVSDFLQSL